MPAKLDVEALRSTGGDDTREISIGEVRRLVDPQAQSLRYTDR